MRKFLVGLTLWVGVSGISQAMTAGNILTRARQYLKDQATSATRQTFTDANLLQFVSDGQREANSYAWLIQQRYSFTLVAGTTEYALPTDFIASMRTMYKKGSGTSWFKLDQVSFNQMDADNVSWMSIAGGTPIHYYVYMTTTPVLGVIPSPIAASTGTVQVDYVASTLDVSATTDTPFNGFGLLTPYHSYLVYYVVCRGYRQLEENDLAQPFCDEWANSITIMRSGLNKMPDFNPGFQGRRSQ